jgi:DNA-binding transcriptional MerR regulator
MTGASRQVIRVYCQLYPDYLSTEATPLAGMERHFTEADLKLISFIYGQTSIGAAHNEVQEMLKEGALESFAWAMPEAPDTPVGASPAQSSQLVPIDALRATQAVLVALQDERDRVLEGRQGLEDEIKDLRQQLGFAQGELAAIKAAKRRPPTWWTRLFGSGD